MGQQSMMDQSMHSQQMTPTGAGGAYHPPPSPALSHPSPMAQPTTPLPPSSGMGQPPTPYDGSLQRPSSTTPGQQIPASQRIPGTVQASTPPQSYMIPTFLCRLAQEGLVEILSRFHDFLNSLKTWQPPPGIPNMSQASMDRKTKIQESARTIRHLMKRLRVIYDKIYMECPEDESSVDVMSLIPFHDLNLDGTPNTSSPSSSEDSSEYAYPFHNPQPAVGRDTLSDAHKAALKEHKELSEVLKERNKQLKVLIDHSRTLIWEVNTMLAMRKHCL
ncbi:unnamed protein product [Cyprideis torosa]|uniref:Mediator of RNA polymerase II transcription subunit 30 n=1 Tax=Cyprideis torosa TaxID=163714 RepID=A0A7R8ZQS0_9CRUS|nr:unnamed protein product [Cyprideis torosa]CAG0897060.1 unnamed protein product [Cyprideis torosa]